MKKGLWMVAMLTLWYSGANAVELPPTTTTIPDCIQDQFGNQYDRLGFDLPNRIVTGIVHATQCGADWPMIGSWDSDAAGQIILELSVANTPQSSGCTDMYKLRGVYPAATWNYTSGFGGQPFSYVTCGSIASVSEQGVAGGARRTQAGGARRIP